MTSRAPRLGVVVIGRDEGERLQRCLESIVPNCRTVVYVDSGSTDGSQDYSRLLGVRVVELDGSLPFTAARARNAGFDELLRDEPNLEVVQFVDGDCEVADDWLEGGLQALQGDSRVAVVSGRRRERHPEASLYNLLIDMEWDTPTGYVDSCLGDAMFRRSAFEAVGGYNPTLIAGEEPELCVRLRERGWRVLRIAAEMTLHDAAMTRFSEFWKRARRAGHAFAEGAWLHGTSRYRHKVRNTVSAVSWGALLPIAVVVLTRTTRGLSLCGLALYPGLAAKLFAQKRRHGYGRKPALVYAAFVVVGKFAEAQGAAEFAWNRLTGHRSTLIEYKGTVSARKRQRA